MAAAELSSFLLPFLLLGIVLGVRRNVLSNCLSRRNDDDVCFNLAAFCIQQGVRGAPSR